MDPQQPEQPSNPNDQSNPGGDQQPDQSVQDHEPASTQSEKWLFNGADDASSSLNSASQQKPNRVKSVSWTAPEFVEHQKGINWYLGLAVAALILAALVFVATRDKISTAIVIIAALAFGAFAARKPRVLEYRLDDTGLTIGGKLYSYEQFKSFSVIDVGTVYSIYLMPMKRFMPSLSLYYDQKDEDKIVAILAARMPKEDRHADAIDSFMHRIRF